MRLKQLLGWSLPLVLSAVGAAVPTTQLTELRVQAEGSGSTVSIQASGAFTHTEYRPTDGLLLVDLPGVAPGHFANQSSTINAGGVESYHVHTFRGASGLDTTRVEISLAAHSIVTVKQQTNTALLVEVSGGSASTAGGTPASEKTVSLPASHPDQNAISSQPILSRGTAANRGTAEAASVNSEIRPNTSETHSNGNGRPPVVQGVSVKRSAGGLEIEVKLDRSLTPGALAPKILRLTHPDRIVLDLPGAVPAVQKRNVSVNSDLVKAVRMARNQNTPPVTRIVVDLASPSNYEIVPATNGLALRLTPVQAVTAPVTETHVAEARQGTETQSNGSAATPTSSVTASTATASSASATTPAATAQASATTSAPAQSLNFIRATSPAVVETSTPTRGDLAARHFTGSAADIPLSNLAATGSNAAMQSTTALPATPQTAADAAVNSAPTSCNTTRFSGEPIDVNFRDADVRDFFRLIHEISGLNIVLDPDVRGSLTLRLDDVPWDQALSIVLRNSRLDCELQGNVLRIASTDTLRREADARRAQIEAQQLAVDKITINRYLSYTNANDAKATISQFLSPRGSAVVDKRSNSLIITDIPSVIPNVDRLLKAMDQKTPQVEIEARVVATSRAFARDIGTQFGFGLGTPSASWTAGGNGGPGGSTSPLTDPGVINPKYPFKGNSIPLFSNHPAAGNGFDGITISNATSLYRIDFILTMAESRGLSKILSRPRVVTQNNSQALIRQGIQLPIITSQTLGGPPTTTFINAFLRLTVTPQITADGTIFLNMDVENSNASFAHAVGGNPEVDTQQATTQVLVANGGTVMIGGVVETTTSVTTDQVPLLGSVPVLGNLFKHKAVSTSTNELIFFVSPKIIAT